MKSKQLEIINFSSILIEKGIIESTIEYVDFFRHYQILF